MPLEAEAIAAMTQALRRMETMVAPPERVPHKDSFVFRYANKGIHEAILQKLARSISGLNAVSVLLRAGFVQEAGVLFRTLDEIQEDIIFLATAETNNARTDRHDKYLEAFYSDPVFSRPEGSLDIPTPNLVPRKKIRAHTMSVLGEGVNAFSGVVEHVVYRGQILTIAVRAGDHRLQADLPTHAATLPAKGDRVTLSVAPDDVTLVGEAA